MNPMHRKLPRVASCAALLTDLSSSSRPSAAEKAIAVSELSLSCGQPGISTTGDRHAHAPEECQVIEAHHVTRRDKAGDEKARGEEGCQEGARTSACSSRQGTQGRQTRIGTTRDDQARNNETRCKQTRTGRTSGCCCAARTQGLQEGGSSRLARCRGCRAAQGCAWPSPCCCAFDVAQERAQVRARPILAQATKCAAVGEIHST